MSSSTTAATSSASSTTAPLAKIEEAQLPIKGVVLFKHGVAYVEREGEVNNDSKIDLFFKSSEMNDVLKSLTVLDLNGGIVSSISYAANRSVHDQLEDITVRIPERQSLTGLLNQLKGSRVKVITKEDKEFEGVVLGTEVFNVKVGETEVEKPHLNLLVGGAKLVTLDIIELKSVAFLDDHLKKDIEHLLNILISSKKKDSKQLTIHCAGKGGRTIYLSYVVAAPLWKTSYRLIVQPKKVGEKKEYEKECTLQAWALVDNTMDEDWTNVRLSLVSGLPISFIHDLYNPRYKKRPVVEVKTEAETGVPQLESAVSRRSVSNSYSADPFGSSASYDHAYAPPPSLSKSEARASTAPVVVRNVEAGDLFHYEIAHAVTVKRNGAALVPIFFGKTQCERLVVYNRKIREKNPMSSLLIKNTTNVALEGGPVTVYEDEAYVGEAMLDTLRANEEKMIPYSVELGVVVSIDNKSSNDKVHEIGIGSGYMYQYYWQVRTTIYNIDNKSEKSLTMVLEHEFAKGYDLFDTPEYIEKTENNYRFKMQLEPKQSTKFIVKEKYLTNSSIYLSEGTVTPNQIQTWISSSFIDKEIEAKLQELANVVKTMNENRVKIQEIDRAIAEIFTDQGRVRENLKVLNEEDSKALRQKYLKTLEAQEDQLKKHNTDKDALNKLIQQASSQFQKAIQGITFSKKL